MGFVPPDYDDEFEEAILSGDRRVSLEAIRKYLAHELGGHRCDKCAMSQLRTGDTAALVLRLQKVLEEIESLPVVDGEVTTLEIIRGGKDRESGSSDSPRPLGSKNAQRRSTGRRSGS